MRTWQLTLWGQLSSRGLRRVSTHCCTRGKRSGTGGTWRNPGGGVPRASRFRRQARGLVQLSGAVLGRPVGGGVGMPGWTDEALPSLRKPWGVSVHDRHEAGGRLSMERSFGESGGKPPLHPAFLRVCPGPFGPSRGAAAPEVPRLSALCFSCAAVSTPRVRTILQFLIIPSCTRSGASTLPEASSGGCK